MNTRQVTLPRIPSLPAVWAALLTRPPVPRGNDLPDKSVRVRSVQVRREFAERFAKSLNPASQSRAYTASMPWPSSQHVHPGALHALAYPLSLSLMATPRFPTPVVGLIHMHNALLMHVPIRPGDELDIETHARSLAWHRRGRTFEIVTTFMRDGSIVATDVSTYLARGSFPQPSEPTPEWPASDNASHVEASERAALGSYPCDAPPSVRWKLDSGTGRSFARASGDLNPIHVASPLARAFGFSHTVAHGMYAASRALSEIAPDLSAPTLWEVRFRAPIQLPSTLWMSYDGAAESGAETSRASFAGRSISGKSGEATVHFEGRVSRLGPA